MDHVIQLTPARCKRKLSFDDVLAGKFPAGHIGELKEDDCRYLLHIDPFGNGKNVLTSRRISVETGRFVEKQDWCPFIRDHQFPKSMRGVVLDGGIYKPGLVSTDVVRAMRDGSHVYYVAWDVLRAGAVDYCALKQSNRWGYLDHLFATGLPRTWLKPSVRHKHPIALLREVIARKDEGIVLKDPNAPYGLGWTKVKEKATFDVVILGYSPPTSEIYARKGWIGQILCGQVKYLCANPIFKKQSPQPSGDGYNIVLPDGHTYYCITVANVKNMTDDLRAKISGNKDKYIGRVLTLSAQEQLASGKLRNPSVIGLRDDKNPEDCLFNPGNEA